MKRKIWLALPVILAMVAPSVMAGPGHDHAKCTASAQDCLDKMTASMKNSGWLGIELDKDTETGTLTIKRVVEGGPAEAAGFQVGDVLVAVNGVKYADDNKEALMAVKKQMAPGKTISYLVSRGGYEKKLSATLREVPSEVLAQWVGNHMLEHANETAIAKN